MSDPPGSTSHEINYRYLAATPLLAGGTELRELGDRRHLVQQPRPVEPALLHCARRLRQLRGHCDSTFDY